VSYRNVRTPLAGKEEACRSPPGCARYVPCDKIPANTFPQASGPHSNALRSRERSRPSGNWPLRYRRSARLGRLKRVLRPGRLSTAPVS